MNIFKRVMFLLIGILLVLALGLTLYLNHPKFGKSAEGTRLERMRASPHFKDGQFHNQHFTPMLAEGYSMPRLIVDQFVKKFPRRRPMDRIPAMKTSLHHLPADSNVLIWFGHSSYFMQINGRRFLVDPVFSSNASPVPFTNRPFNGTAIYTAEDMPEVDYLLITHDHYDHLDYETVTGLHGKVKTVVCGLGVGAHLEHWGYRPDDIIEKDWYEHVSLDSVFELHVLPARHFSGRTFRRNATLWVSFILKCPGMTIYLGGDSGYDTHFAEIGERYGSIDLAILENGQYNRAWRAIHAMPEDVLKAAIELRAKRVMPVHSSKFVLAQHPWDEPLKKITELNQSVGIPLITPMIGEIVRLDDPTQTFGRWWESIE